MTLANYGIGSSRHRDPNSAKVLSKSLQIRNRAELLLKQHLKAHFRTSSEEKRNDILCQISDYYSRIPFNVVIWNKYQTKQCIIDSIQLLDSKFNPYKARDSFRMVEKMLINLVYLPWHTEFRKIFTYSGQFNLSISKPLIGIEEVFKAAGFECDNQDPLHLVLPDDRMPQIDDGESVLSVIFDCLLAQVVMTNIIDIFESNCLRTMSKNQLSELIEYIKSDNDMMNCYSWIQAYFRERSIQITDKATSHVQELLNNMVNFMSKVDTSKSNIGQRHLAERIDNLGEDIKIKSLSNSSLTPQDRTREFLAKQSAHDDNIITIPSDLLKLPSASMESKNLINNTATNLLDNNITQRQINIKQQQQHQFINNGYNLNQHPQQQKQTLAIRSNKLHSIDQPQDMVDNRLTNLMNLHPRNNDFSMSTVDLPHNDREPLIPKYAKRLTSMSSQQINSTANQSSRKINILEHSINPSIGHPYQINNPPPNLSNSRTKLDDQFLVASSSHFNQNQRLNNQQMPASSNFQNGRGGIHSKYNYNDNNSPSKKYNEFRDIENNDRQPNSRSHWSCGTCTYNNLANSEICEMCRNRRSLR